MAFLSREYGRLLSRWGVAVLVVLLCGWAFSLCVAADGVAETVAGDTEYGFRSLLLVGRARGMEGKWEEALALFKRAVEKEPENEEALFSMGTALIELRRFGEAHSILKGMMDAGVENPVVKNNMAWTLLRITDPVVRDVRLALRYAREAALQLHNDPHVWGTLADAHYAAQEYDDALRAARIALMISRLTRGQDVSDFIALVQRCGRASGKSVNNE